MRKIQILIILFRRIFAWGRQNHPDPHFRCPRHPQTPICFCIFPTLLVPGAPKLLAKLLPNKLLAHFRAVQLAEGKKTFFLLERWIKQHPSPSNVKSFSARGFSAAKAVSWLPALDNGSVTGCQVKNLFVWLRALWKLRGFALLVDTRYMRVHGWLHPLKQYRFAWIHNARGCGQVRRSLQSHTCSHSFCRLRAKVEWKRSFSLQLEALDACISLILPTSGKQDESLRRRRYTGGGQAPVELN